MPKKNKKHEFKIAIEKPLPDQKKVESDFNLGDNFVNEKTGSAIMINLDGKT